MATLNVVTLVEAKAAVQKTNTTAYDTLLAAWITSASLRLDREVGPVVQRTVAGELHDGGYEAIYLHYHPITSVTSVTEYDGTTATVLTAETNAVQPVDGYRTRRYSADPAYRGNRITRRSSGASARFPAGEENIEATYVAGRFADTASVDERFKQGVRLMLKHAMRLVEDGTGQVGDYDVPIVAFPTFSLPAAVRDLFPGEIQDPTPM